MPDAIVQYFSDPIHKSIGVTSLEKAVIDSPIFQRLRRIKQLGNVHLLFPAAVHNRFSHSLGVMHVISLLVDAIFAEKVSLGMDAQFSKDVQEIKSIVRLAGLLHDVGHGPLSHHFEDCLRELKDNSLKNISYREWNSDLCIPENWITLTRKESFFEEELAHEHFSYGLICKLGATFDFDAQSVCAMLCEDIEPSAEFDAVLSRVAREYSTVGSFHGSLRLCLKSLLSGEIDADRLDYLMRDSYFCGTSIAAIDLPYLLCSVKLAFHNEEFHVAINRSAVHVVENILVSRKQMFNQVYYHRINGTFDMMLSKVIDHLLTAKALIIPRSLDYFISLTDEELETLAGEIVVDDDLDVSSASLSQIEGLADVCAKFYLTRTPLKRLSTREVFDEGTEVEDAKKDLKKVYGDEAIIWEMKLKRFYGKDRYKPEQSEYLKVAPRSADANPQSLRDASEVIQSNLWQKDRVRIVAFKGYRESAEERKIKEKLSLLNDQINARKKRAGSQAR